MTNTITSRRAMLTGGAAVLATIAAPAAASMAAPNPDAGLIQLDALQRAADARCAGSDAIADDGERMTVLEPIWNQQGELARRIIDHRARTLEGLRARARLVAEWNDRFDSGGWDEGIHAAMAHSILRDLISHAGESR